MHDFDFLRELVIISTAALVIVLVFQRLKVPSVIGLIVTGIVLGQSGLKIIEDISLISTLAELGVVLLLFAIGLEFSVEELRRLSRIVIVGGVFQVLLTAAIVGGLAYVFAANYWRENDLAIGNLHWHVTCTKQYGGVLKNSL
jgi:CPA2 family monovalent cation:H+ antiporter-2